MSKSNPTTRPDAPNYEVVGNMIHRYERMTIAEAFGVLSERKEPLCGFRDADFQPWQQGNLYYVHPGGAEPYRTTSGAKFQQCARITAEDPRKVPEGVPELPEPWLAYVPKIEADRLSSDQIPKLWGLRQNCWTLTWYSTDTFAIDVRTAFARKHFPEYVQALAYPIEEPVPKVCSAAADSIDPCAAAILEAAKIMTLENSAMDNMRIVFDAGREYERKAAK